VTAPDPGTNPAAMYRESRLRLTTLMEGLLRSTPSWAPALDALTHEWDVRGAAGVPGDRDAPDVAFAGRRLLGLLRVPAELTIDLDGEVISCQPAGDDSLPRIRLPRELNWLRPRGRPSVSD
jgi:hypothetical protein